MTQAGGHRIDEILRFWFGSADPAAAIEPQRRWFAKDEAFDRAVADEFGIEIEMALSGGLSEWTATPAGLLAMILLLDQFTRNCYRGNAKCHAGDAKALALAGRVVDAGWDRSMGTAQRLFLYLPFEHSEALADQDRAIALIGPLGNAEWTDYAHRHRAIIARFGRFPHRNALLGRQSTAEELEFLSQPGSSF